MKDAVKDVASDVTSSARRLSDHPWFEKLARAGFVMSGLVHAMIGWICIRLATGSSGESADQSGALAEFASAPAGSIFLIISGIAMIALSAYHLLDIFFGAAAREDGKDRLVASAKAGGKAVTYGALAYTSLKFGLGSGSSSDTESMSAPFIANPIGKVLVIVVGLAIIAIGGYHVYKGATKKFLEDLDPSGNANIGQGIRITGMVGYIAKGAALVGVGAMVVWAATSADPEKAGGMDAAFKEILSLPAGSIILLAIAVGFILYGIYSIFRAKYADMD